MKNGIAAQIAIWIEAGRFNSHAHLVTLLRLLADQKIDCANPNTLRLALLEKGYTDGYIDVVFDYDFVTARFINPDTQVLELTELGKAVGA